MNSTNLCWVLLRKQILLSVALCVMGYCGAVEAQADTREAWTTSKLLGTPDPPKPYMIERVYPDIAFNQPVELMRLGNTGRMLLLEVTGKVYTFEDRPDCQNIDLAMDLKPHCEQFTRAFGIAPHPQFDTNRQIFMVYGTDPIARPDGNRLSRFRMSDAIPPTIDPASEEILLTWASGGHSGSAIRFDGQGYLYFSAGDGARPFPPDEYDVSQDLSDLRASICRIDIDHREADRPYRIPPDNPFVNTPQARPEVWAFGFRNPWRFSIDPLTQAMHCGDVGWELWELVHRVERGGNYGWSIFEGPQMIRSDIPLGPAPISKPLLAYPHTAGQSVTGGLVYRGSALGELEGAYIYGDYVSGKIWGLRSEADRVTWQAEIADTGLPIITFSQDKDGEILVVGYNGGIHRLIRNPEPDLSSEFPARLSQTGLFANLATLEPNPGVVPYRLQAHAFEGMATSSYVVAVPGLQSIELKPLKKQFVYPANTVFAKTLYISSIQDQKRQGVSKDSDGPTYRLETQILHFDGRQWNPYTYVWRDDQSDADLASSAGATIDARLPDGRTSSWRVHSRSECASCHTSQAGIVAGWDFANLNGPSIRSNGLTQLQDFEQQGVVRGPIKAPWLKLTMVDPRDTTASLDMRARSYLAMNCSQCHCRGGGGTVALELPFSHSPSQWNAINYQPTQGTFGIENAKVIVPGKPEQSILFYRMATAGMGHMPKLWGRENDAEGLALIHDWIVSLADNTSQSSSFSESQLDVNSLTTASGLQAFHALITGELSGEKAQTFVALGKSSPDPILRGLFERFVPPGERVKRLGTSIEPAAILAMRGDPVLGRERFFHATSWQCRNCHRVEGQGRSLGPDLDRLGAKRSREELLESIIEPSRKIEPAFANQAILTTDGNQVTGLVIEKSEQHLLLRSLDGREHRIPNDEIEEAKTLGVSLMPVGLAAEMTADELADLIAFLESLK